MHSFRKTPHILILAPLFPPFKGAAASRLYSFAKYWGRLTKVSVVSPNHLSRQESFYKVNFPLSKWRLDFLHLPWIFPKLFRKVKALNPDVIVASVLPVWSLWEGYFLVKRLGVPLILDVRDLPQGDIRSNRTSLIRVVLKVLHIYSLKHLGGRACRITTVTDWLKKELTEFLEYPAHCLFVIRNGSEIDVFKKALLFRKEFELVYSGSFISIRNPQAILEYLSFLAELRPSFRMLFVSSFDSPLGKKFLEGISERGLSGNIAVQSMCEPNELPEYLGKAWLGFTSLIPSEYAYKGVASAKNYEYLAAGLPIIGLLDSDFYVETRRLIADNRVGILDPSPKNLAAETAALLKDSARLRRMSKRARKVGERFDRKRLAEECYYKVILPAWEEFNARKLGGR